MTALSIALGATLFHFLWQGLAIALLLVLALSVTRTARLRYAIACVAMFAMPAAFFITLALSIPDAGSRHALASVLNTGMSHGAAAAGISTPHQPLLQRLEGWMRWFEPFWIAGLLVFYVRGVASWVAVRRLRREGSKPASPVWQDRVRALARLLGIARPLLLLESARVDVPVVAGLMRPVILMPIGLLAAMPVEQLEYLLIHELAHVRRLDYLVNLLQKAVEGLLFYHPAVWWTSSILNAERENCCDDTVLSIRGDARGYAATLAAVEQGRISGHAALSLAATGGSLSKRIRRMLNRQSPATAAAPFVSTALLAASFVVAVAAFQSPLRLAAQQPENKYDKWLHEDVAYIIQAEERSAFLALKTDEERDRMIEQFWLRRDPTPGTVENEMKQEHYRRIAFANLHFKSGVPGWKTDRGRIYIIFGPPDEIDSHPSCGADRPHEEWQYRHIEGIGDNVQFRFVDPDCNGEYRMILDAVDTPVEKPIRRK